MHHLTVFKQIITVAVAAVLIEACCRLPSLRRCLATAGVTPRYFGERAVPVPMPNCAEALRITGLDVNHLAFQLFWRGINYYEPFTRATIEQLTASADLFIDVGANMGFFSLIATKRNPGLRVVAFEPNPKMYNLLCENKRLNSLSTLTTKPFALSNEEGEACLFLSESDMSASLRPGFQDEFSPSIGSVPVRTTTLDSYMQRLGAPNTLVLKIDVEGHEAAFLAGAQCTIATLKPDIVIEVLGDFDASLIQQFRNHGYRFYKITDRGLIESDVVQLTKIGDFTFFNYLFSTRPTGELCGISARIRELAGGINLYHTSKYPSHPVSS